MFGPWVRGNEIADKFTREGSIQKFIGPGPSLGVSRQNVKNKIKRWVDNQNLVMWRGPCSTQRQARKLISEPSLAAKTGLLSFSRTQSTVVTDVLTGYNTLRRHLCVMGFSNNLARGRKPQSTLCLSVGLRLHSDMAYLGPFFLDPEDIMNLSIGTIRSFGKGTGLL